MLTPGIAVWSKGSGMPPLWKGRNWSCCGRWGNTNEILLVSPLYIAQGLEPNSWRGAGGKHSADPWNKGWVGDPAAVLAFLIGCQVGSNKVKEGRPCFVNRFTLVMEA